MPKSAVRCIYKWWCERNIRSVRCCFLLCINQNILLTIFYQFNKKISCHSFKNIILVVLHWHFSNTWMLHTYLVNYNDRYCYCHTSHLHGQAPHSEWNMGHFPYELLHRVDRSVVFLVLVIESRYQRWINASCKIE